MEKATVTQTKRPQRILLLVTQADWGGVQWFLTQFAADLIKEGHDVLLAAGGEGELWDRAAELGITTHRLKHMRRNISPVNFVHDILAIHEIAALIDQWKPDAVDVNSTKMGVLGSLASHLSHHHPWTTYRIGGWVFLEPLPETVRWLYRTIERISARWKDVIVTLHPGDEAAAKQFHITPRHRLCIVPNGIDAISFVSRLQTRAAARQTVGVPEHAFVIGTVANAYAPKALIPYLDALDLALKEDVNSFGVIIGDGPQFEELQRKRKTLATKDRIILTGRRADAQRLYSAFDINVLPSRKEGMPWTILEAMAAGIPVIATDVGSCRWMLSDPQLGNAGIIVPPNDTMALVHAIHHLRTNPDERRALGQGGWHMSTQRFSWKETLRGNRDSLNRI